MPTVMPTGPSTTTGPTFPTGTPGATGASGPSQGDSVTGFFTILNDPLYSIIGPVSRLEADQARTMFSVVNMLFAGKGERVVGGDRKTDVLGVLTLYYGLQDKSLTSKILVDSQAVFGVVGGALLNLRN